METQSPYRRILLKLSGEVLMGQQGFGIDPSAAKDIATSLQRIHQQGIELAIVIGGGNIFRGIKLGLAGMPRTPADHLGMLATLLNGVALEQALKALGAPVCVMSAIECPLIVESYNWRKAQDYLSSGKIVIFVGGTGNPYFTTDTAAALRANEIHADVFAKATKVDGVYDKDPLEYADAKKYSEISYSLMLEKQLKVMDSTAVTLCLQNKLPIFVFNMNRLAQEPIEKIFSDDDRGTWVRS